METVKLMNLSIWVFAGLLIGWVIVQSILYLRLALNFNKRNKLMDQSEIKSCFKVGAVAAFGPAVNSAAIVLTLIASVGSATAFMRCGVIGAPLQEMYIAEIAATTAGVEFGTEAVTPAVFTFIIFCMGFAVLPYFLNCLIALKPLDLAVEKAKEGSAKISFVPYLGKSAALGLITFCLMNYISSTDKMCVVVVTLIVGILIHNIVQKTGNKFLNTFNLAICMAIGMAVGEMVNQFLL